MTTTVIKHERMAQTDNGYWTLEALIIEAVKKELGVKRVNLGRHDGKHWEGRDLCFSKAKADGCPITVYCELDQWQFDIDCWNPEYNIQILMD